MSKMIYPTTNLTATEQLIIARERGYHGVTVAAAALTGLPANKPTRQAFSNNAVALFC